MTIQKFQYEISRLYENPHASIGDFLSYAKQISMISDALPSHIRRARVAFLSSYTILGLSETFFSIGLFYNVWADCYNAPYNQFAQTIFDGRSGLYHHQPKVIYFLVDAKNIDSAASLDEYLHVLLERTSATIVVFRFVGDAHAMHLNDVLEKNWFHHPRVEIFGFDKFLERIGKQSYWNTKFADLGDFRIAPQAFPLIADELIKYAVDAVGCTKKCLVLDLDNTLWEGIVGEDGLNGIKPKKNIQDYIKELFERGIILAINSNNNERDAILVFENHGEMVLRKEHFSAWRINWNSKIQNIAELAQELNIGTESMVFVDDDPFQREAARSANPEIAVLHPNHLFRYSGFFSRRLSREDKERSKMYAEERKRKRLQTAARSVEEFLQSLSLTLYIVESSPEILSRMSQLTQKTNQFNVTTRRYSEDDIRSLLEQGWKVFAARVVDKFGDYGIVGTCIIAPENLQNGLQWRIDVFLLSCRALGREIEKAFLYYIMMKAREKGVLKIRSEYIPTEKNKPCEFFYPNNNFRSVEKLDKGDVFEFDLTGSLVEKPSFIEIIEPHGR